MAHLKNTMSLGPAGALVSRARMAQTGDPASYIFVNGQVLATNNNQITTDVYQYVNTLASKGIPVTIAKKVSAGGPGFCNLRWDIPASPGRVVARRALYFQTGATGDNSLLQFWGNSARGILQFRSGNRVRVMFPNGTVIGGSVSPALSANTLYWVEFAITPESSAGAGDGILAYRILDENEQLVYGYSTADDGAAPSMTVGAEPVQLLYVYGATKTNDEWDCVGSIQAAHLSTGWLGPISIPLTFPSAPTITSHTRPSAPGATDGSITVSWSPVAHATSYEAHLSKNGDAPTRTSTTATSPYTFTNLSAGEYGVFVQAMP